MTKILKSYKGIPYEVAKQKLETLLDALDVVLTGQSYTIGSRTLTRANLTAIQEAIKYYEHCHSNILDWGHACSFSIRKFGIFSLSHT